MKWLEGYKPVIEATGKESTNITYYTILCYRCRKLLVELKRKKAAYNQTMERLEREV